MSADADSMRVMEKGRTPAGTCNHCGNPIETIWGWIVRGSETLAVYQVRLLTGHVECGAVMLLTFADGPYTRDPANRRSVAIAAYCEDGRAHFSVVDANDGRWDSLGERPGRLLTREEATLPHSEPIVERYLFEILQHDTRLHLHFAPGLRGGTLGTIH